MTQTGERIEQLVIDEVFDWRCGAVKCFYHPLLGRFSMVGGVHIQIGRRSSTQPINYLFNVLSGTICVHCPSCHEWRELFWNEESQTFTERQWHGYVPLIGCRCEFEKIMQQAAAEKGAHDAEMAESS